MDRYRSESSSHLLVRSLRRKRLSTSKRRYLRRGSFSRQKIPRARGQGLTSSNWLGPIHLLLKMVHRRPQRISQRSQGGDGLTKSADELPSPSHTRLDGKNQQVVDERIQKPSWSGRTEREAHQGLRRRLRQEVGQMKCNGHQTPNHPLLDPATSNLIPSDSHGCICLSNHAEISMLQFNHLFNPSNLYNPSI